MTETKIKELIQEAEKYFSSRGYILWKKDNSLVTQLKEVMWRFDPATLEVDGLLGEVLKRYRKVEREVSELHWYPGNRLFFNLPTLAEKIPYVELDRDDITPEIEKKLEQIASTTNIPFFTEGIFNKQFGVYLDIAGELHLMLRDLNLIPRA